MEERYCIACYRTIASDSTICPSCEVVRRPSHSVRQIVLILGAAGLPLLLAGMLALNLRICLAGAAISGTAALIHALLALKS